MIKPGPLEVGLIVSAVAVVAVITGSVIFIIKLLTKKKNFEFKKGDEIYLEIAKERFAKGEISLEQYEQIKKEFSSTNLSK
jgi:uncharacterized membrane protein